MVGKDISMEVGCLEVVVNRRSNTLMRVLFIAAIFGLAKMAMPYTIIFVSIAMALSIPFFFLFPKLAQCDFVLSEFSNNKTDLINPRKWSEDFVFLRRLPSYLAAGLKSFQYPV